MAVTFVQASSGPNVISPPEKHVRIIFLEVTPDMGPVPADGPTPGQIGMAASRIGSPQPTDIIVFAGRPWHFGLDKVLHAHPEVHVHHPETILTLSRKAEEKAVWWSDRPFTIVGIEPVQQHGGSASGASPAAPAAPYPFSSAPLTDPESAADAAMTLHVARSTVPIAEAVNHRYKISFTIAGAPAAIDPDMHCGN